MTDGELVGVEAILDYLSMEHGVAISRETLNQLRHNPKRKASTSQIVADAKPFPAKTRFVRLRTQVVADKVAVDKWIARNLKTDAPPVEVD